MIPTQTLARFIYSQQRKHAHTTGELSDLLASLALGFKMIGRLVSTAGFKGLYGYTGSTNVQGEKTRILDEEADQILVDILGSSGHFGLLVSEERDDVVATDREVSQKDGAKYVLAFDPLDGSSNIGSNIPVGTIFTIFKKKEPNQPASLKDFLQTGRKIVASGYCVYGGKMTLVYSCGDGVHGFTFDPGIGEFMLTEENIQIPRRGAIYSVNEGNYWKWPAKVRGYVDKLKTVTNHTGRAFSGRYVGSLVADFDRNLRMGGVYIYPEDDKHPRGKLRLLYEGMPLAFIAEQAGGRATDGTRNILDIVPTDIHERCPLVIGSAEDVKAYEEFKA